MSDSHKGQDVQLGKADWVYYEDLGAHMPVCTYVNKSPGGYGAGKCRNGPLTGDEITEGKCKDHGAR